MRYDLDGAPFLSLVLPGAVLQAALDRNLPPLGQIVGTVLSLPVPDGDAEEVGLGILGAAIDREPEGRQSLLLAELAQLDVAGQVADQNDAVHESPASSCRLRQHSGWRVTDLCRKRLLFVPPRGVAQPGSALRSGRRGPQFKSGHPDRTWGNRRFPHEARRRHDAILDSCRTRSASRACR